MELLFLTLLCTGKSENTIPNVTGRIGIGNDIPNVTGRIENGILFLTPPEELEVLFLTSSEELEMTLLTLQDGMEMLFLAVREERHNREKKNPRSYKPT